MNQPAGTSASLSDRLAAYILEEVAIDLDPHASLADDFPLIERGAIDSLGLFQLVAFLEEHCDVDIDDTDLLHENFRDLRSILRFVERKRRPGS